MNEIKVIELNPQDFLARYKKELDQSILIDVREPYENDLFNLGGVNVPMGELLPRLIEFNSFAHFFLYCATGKRSYAIGYHIKKRMQEKVVYSLFGGVEALQKSTHDSF